MASAASFAKLPPHKDIQNSYINWFFRWKRVFIFVSYLTVVLSRPNLKVYEVQNWVLVHSLNTCALDDYDKTTHYPLRLSIWNRYANTIRQNGRMQHVVWSESRRWRWGVYYYFNVAGTQILCSYYCLFFSLRIVCDFLIGLLIPRDCVDFESAPEKVSNY